MQRWQTVCGVLLLVVGAAVPTASAGRPSAGLGVRLLPPHSGDVRNHDVEPESAVAGDGTLWIASTDGLEASRNHGGLRSGADVWRSTDHGQTFSWVAAPFASLPKSSSAGGGETDIAAAPVRNAEGHFNVYVVSAQRLATVPAVGTAATVASLAFTRDGGATWNLRVLGGKAPMADRPWVVADGACSAYVVYHGITVFDITFVDRYDLCDIPDNALGNSLTPVISSRLPVVVTGLVTGEADNYFVAGFGRPVVTAAHHLAVPMMGCEKAKAFADARRDYSSPFGSCPGKTLLFVLSSGDGGTSWQRSDVATGRSSQIRFWPVALASDAVGSLYFAWTDDHSLFLTMSRDQGRSWGRRVALTDSAVPAALLPALVTMGPGRVAVAFYSTGRSGDPNSAAAMGRPGAVGAASWVAQVRTSKDFGQTFSAGTRTPVLHRGAFCVQAACGNDGDTDLGNTLGLTANSDGSLVLTVTTDQHPAALKDPATGWAVLRAPSIAVGKRG